jgi:hypothetical protein
VSPVADDRSPLLYLVHRIPFPPNKGDKVRSFNILRQLARRHRVFLGTFVDHPDDGPCGRLAEWCEESHVVRLDPRLARVLSLRGLLGGEALSLPYYRDAGLRQWVADVVAREGIRQAVAFSGPMAQYLDVPGLDRRIIDFCDLDSAKWTQYAPDHRWPMSWLYRREGASSSPSSARPPRRRRQPVRHRGRGPALPAGRARGGGAGRRDAERRRRRLFQPDHTFDSPFPPGGPVLLFTGAMDYWPNIDAVVWFAGELLPKVRQQFPDARFWIVGMNPRRRFRRWRPRASS